MKKIITVFCFLIFIGSINAQQASDYFPAQTGFDWKFKQTPLDSLNNPVTSAAVFTVDSFAAVANFEGKLANIVLTKTGSLQTIQYQPYLDSLYYNTEGTIGFEYFSIGNIEEFLIALDSAGITTNFSFLDFFISLQDWYDVYRFASAVNSEYTLLQKDTTITISSVTYNLRFKYSGKRLQDQTIQTVLGSFDCKKFLTQWKVYYMLGPIPFELISTNDSIWIAPDNWIVQDIIPANPIDLSLLGIDPFFIPGLETKLTDEIVVTVPKEDQVPNTFSLKQNYPNPFNPTTNIGFWIADRGFVSLKVYDILGNEVATLVNEEKPAGSYEVEFSVGQDSSPDIASGIYFYKLQAGSFVETKKMILMK
jgi:hypothetical protein